MNPNEFPVLEPPPPIPLRTRQTGIVNSSPPQIGWNLPEERINQGTRNSTSIRVSSSRGDNVFLNPPSRAASLNVRGDRTDSSSNHSRTRFGHDKNNLSTNSSKILIPERSKGADFELMSLSPDFKSLNTAIDFSEAMPKTYSVDLEGLNFNASPCGLKVEMPPEKSNDTLSNIFKYDKVRNDFKDPNAKSTSLTENVVLPSQSNFSVGAEPSQYGWNSCFFPANNNYTCQNPWVPVQQNKNTFNSFDSHPQLWQPHHQVTQHNQQTHQFQRSQKQSFDPWGLEEESKKNDSNSVLTVDKEKTTCTQRFSSDFSSLPKSASKNTDPFEDFLFSDDTSIFSNETHAQKLNSDSGNSDLMHFSSVDEEEYLSLSYFDPLHQRARKESVTSGDKAAAVTYSVANADGSTDNVFSGKSTTLPGASSLYPTVPLNEVPETDDELERFLRNAHKHSPETQTFQHQESNKHVPRKQKPKRPEEPQKTGGYEKLRQRLFVDEESEAFCQMVANLKGRYKSTDERHNLGFVVSPICDKQQNSISVKIVIYSDYSSEPVPFTCDIHVLVELIISNVLFNNLNMGDMHRSVSSADFILKVFNRSEYLINSYKLSKYEYVHDCLKMDQDIRLTLMRRQDVMLPFLRTIDDDTQTLYFPKDYIKTDLTVVTRDQLEVLMKTFYAQIENLRDHVLREKVQEMQIKGLKQSVKAVCMTLAKIETIDIKKKLQRIEGIVNEFMSQGKLEALNNQQPLNSEKETQKEIQVAIKCSLIEEMEEVLEQLLTAVKDLVNMYCRTFHTDYLLGSAVAPYIESVETNMLEDNFILHVATANRLPVTWAQKFDCFKVVCSLYYGKNKIEKDETTSSKKITLSDLCQLECIVWDEWISFDRMSLSTLPREGRVCLTLCGIKNHPATGGTSATNPLMVSPLGGATVQLYSQKGELISGPKLIPLKMYTFADPLMPFSAAVQSDSVLLQINLPDFDKRVQFPEITHIRMGDKKSFDMLLPDIQKIVLGTLEKDCISSCQADELEILWQYRHYLTEYPNLLSWILQGVKQWDWPSLSDIYSLLNEWPVIEPMQALELLMPQYPDSHVRGFAVNCLKKMTTDDLKEFIPQLIQALKYESYHSSELAELLLEESFKSIRFAHKLFWLLKGAAQDSAYKHRYELMFVALVNVAGDALYQELKREEDFVKSLTLTAEKVQVSKDKDNVLKSDIQNVHSLFEDKREVLLPYNPGLSVSGIDLKSCSYFTSNAFPLKLVFKNSSPKADPVYVMFKVGDDLRQDMLTLQMIKIMDKLWLKSGLDLKMITFSCLATGPKRGLVELITESETLRKIQVSYGVTGSFKDRPIKEWLQKHNPTELEYQKSVENFTRSCAGYCVATYVLGICDRHNDNIMLKNSGHMFHIDFNKFLGDSQMFGNIKRDRVPFVLTSDMAYVINNGEKRSDRFQNFIDLCCQALNIIRKNANLFLNLFALMSRAGIPGVTEESAQYIQRVLLPGVTDAKASAVFTKMIEDSLKSVFTQFNFFIHNLAQLKFSGHQEGDLLSFVPKTYSVLTDGKIKSAVLHGYQKRYTPEKHYIFIVKILRENQRDPSYIFRHYTEFVEFHQKLASTFPLITWPSLPSRMVIGRSQVKSVAENRKQEIEKFLSELFQKTAEVVESDLVYTFFHPLLRDEQEAQKEKLNLPKLRDNNIQLVQRPNQFGQLKLSLQYDKETLVVLVSHARDLTSRPDQPSSYVKLYLLPDPEKLTKRKTKIVKDSTHPTYNEVIEYAVPLYSLKNKTLQVSVWEYDKLKENSCLGAVYIKLHELDLSKANVSWYQLGRLQISNSMLA